MDIHHSAQSLGRLGGLARARALPAARRSRIASQAGYARSLSRHAARRVARNFVALEAVLALRRVGRAQGLAR